MSVAIATPTVTAQWKSGQEYKVMGTLAITASTATYATGGIALNFFQEVIKATRTPLSVKVWGEQAQSGQTQYDYSYVPGADASAGLLKIFTGGSEIAASAVPSGVSGDVINFEAIWQGMY